MGDFCKLLSLSTVHVKPETEQRLEAGKFGWLPTYRKPNPNKDDESFGTWVCLGDISIDDNIEGSDIPDDLKAVLKYAEANDATWIMFDCDAPVNEDLPTYESHWQHCSARSEVVSDLKLLQAYMAVTYPSGLFAVQEFLECDSWEVNNQLFAAYMEAGFKIKLIPGYTIVEIDQEFKNKLMCDFNKSGVDIWVFRDGELIDETR